MRVAHAIRTRTNAGVDDAIDANCMLRYGHRHVAYYVLLCSLLGSVTVMSCKGVSTFLNLWVCCGAPSPFGNPVLYLLCLILGSTALLQIK